MKERLQHLGYDLEGKEIPDVEIRKLDRDSYFNTLKAKGFILHTPAASLRTGESSWMICLDTESILQDLIPSVEIHEIVQSIEVFNGSERDEAEKKAILYEYLSAQEAGLLERMHQFITSEISRQIEMDDLFYKTIEDKRWRLKIREEIFQQLTSA